MDVVFRAFDPESDAAGLADLLRTGTWEYRVKVNLSAEDVAGELADGTYSGPSVLTLVLEQDGRIVGLTRAFDLGPDDGDPEIDFRLRAEVRGRGLGTEAVRRITASVFEAHPQTMRIEGQTRADNTPMRRAFRRAGYVQEAVYRQAWPAGDGTRRDGIGYAILRSDWESGTVTPLDWSDP